MRIAEAARKLALNQDYEKAVAKYEEADPVSKTLMIKNCFVFVDLFNLRSMMKFSQKTQSACTGQLGVITM